MVINIQNFTQIAQIPTYKCEQWCKAEVNNCIVTTKSEGVIIMAISLLTISISALISAYSQEISKATEIKEEIIIKIAMAIQNFSYALMSVYLIYYYFFGLKK